MVLWQLYRSRNDKIWNDKDSSHRIMIYAALEFHFSWLEARARTEGTSSSFASRQVISWKKPPPSFLKCNMDASLSKNLEATGLAFVIRNAKGGFISSHTMRLPDLLSAK